MYMRRTKSELFEVKDSNIILYYIGARTISIAK